MSVHSTNMHHSASFCTSSIFVFCSRCASCQQNYNFCYHTLPIFWLQDQFWQVCVYWILLRQMKAWEKRTNYECTFDQYASFCTKQLSYYLQQTWFLSTKLQFLLLQVTILWLQDQFWQVWLLNSAQTNEGLRKKNTLWVHIWPMCIILRQAAFLFSAADLNPVNKMAIFVAKSYLDYSLVSRPILTGVATKFCSDK